MVETLQENIRIQQTYIELVQRKLTAMQKLMEILKNNPQVAQALTECCGDIDGFKVQPTGATTVQ